MDQAKIGKFIADLRNHMGGNEHYGFRFLDF